MPSPDLIAVAPDPHHDGRDSWGMTQDFKLYHRSEGESSWTRVKRISYTPDRVQRIYSLMESVTETVELLEEE